MTEKKGGETMPEKTVTAKTAPKSLKSSSGLADS